MHPNEIMLVEVVNGDKICTTAEYYEMMEDAVDHPEHDIRRNRMEALRSQWQRQVEELSTFLKGV